MRKTRKQGNGYYACAITKVPVTWNCFIQPCRNLTTTMNMTLPPCLCNLKSLQWNPGVRTMIQVQLRGLSPTLNVATMDKIPPVTFQTVPFVKTLWKNQMWHPPSIPGLKATKNKAFSTTHAQLGLNTFSTLPPPNFNSFPPDFVGDQLAGKANCSTECRHWGP